MIDALMLYGSAARRDTDENSDIDLLAVCNTDLPYSHKVNGIEIQFMNADKLIEMGQSGNLFAMHLAYEGQVIFDFSGHFSRLKDSAVPKKSYSEERKKALDLGWFLHDFGEEYDPALVNKRIAWCVRTVVISLLAEKGEIAFSPAVLAERFPLYEVPFLIGLRRSNLQSHARMIRLNSFLMGFCAMRPDASSPTEFLDYFNETQNEVAVGTYRQLVKKAEDSFGVYC
ncbi:anti-phage Hailong system nucleotidyltransferase HalB [Roseibium alexandrii]|uniref:Nucleotidyltransferase domain protein n=1 Tax=Roseibium alexandrii (strain DSM 17067 / NCIMB 14079 / DFL-11) TaxID=244592 RepID=A0A5E8GX97_ROSAD|nr:nucleotidyltransferase domain-containing protein [Roseibium alexandrii]EEE44249.1 Nucleotidyltransferase domain protein [Roseibium alexandrii DFL-11]